ncbi:MAG: CHAT domain-containing protein [Anaerolineae bacterium]|nr:CHAT domain-containing protein [Anaerolineae bacterium]
MTEQSTYQDFDVFLDCKLDANNNFQNITLKDAEGNKCTVHYNFSKPVGRIKKAMAMAKHTTESSQWLDELGAELQGLFFPNTGEGRNLTDKFCGFLKKLGNSGKARLRLFYPNDVNKIIALLGVPWEYLYLDSQCTGLEKSYLCLNKRFSLVHCLINKPEELGKCEHLPLKASFYMHLENVQSVIKELDIIQYLALGEKEKLAFAGNDPQRKGEIDLLVQRANDLVIMYKEIAYDLKQSGRPHIIQLSGYHEMLEKEHIQWATETFDIIQYLAHGDIDGLALANGDTYKKAEIINDIQKPKTKVVILGVCSSASSYSGAAVAFHEAGVPIVVGMTQITATSVASSFLEALYTQLAERLCSVEEAVAVARSQLYEEKGCDQFSLHWGIPRLFMRSTHSDLIDRQSLYERVYNISTCKEIREKILPPEQSIDIQSFVRWSKTLREWIDSEKVGMLYLYGRDGSAKSTEVARLLHEYDGQNNKPKLLGHFCRNDDHQTSNPLIFVRDSLYPQLEDYYGADFYRGYLRGVFPRAAYDARFAFYNLFLLPLSRIREKNPEARLPTIIIDAIDDAVARYPSESILDLLIDHQHAITQVARVIITGNYSEEPDSPHQRIRVELEPEIISISEDIISCGQLPTIKETDIEEKIPDASLRALTFKHINEICEPEQKMQLWRFLSDCGADLRKVLCGISKSDKKPLPLENYYQAYLDIVKSKNEYAEDLLRVLLVAYRPLSAKFLKQLFQEVEILNVSKVMDEMPAFIHSTDSVYTCHSSIRRFLNEKLFFCPDPNKIIKPPRDESLKPNYSARSDAHGFFMNLYAGEEMVKLQNWYELNEKWGNYVQNYLPLHAYKCYQYACYGYMEISNEIDDPAELWDHFSQEYDQGIRDGEYYTRSSLGNLNYVDGQSWNRRSLSAMAFLHLISQPSFREFRMYTEGTEAVVDDMLFGLRVTLFEHMLNLSIMLAPNYGSKEYSKHRQGFARLITAYEHILDILTEDKEKELIGLERKVRGVTDWRGAWEAFKEYLGLTGEYIPHISESDSRRAEQKAM